MASVNASLVSPKEESARKVGGELSFKFKNEKGVEEERQSLPSYLDIR